MFFYILIYGIYFIYLDIEQSRAQDTKKFDNFEQRLAKSSDILDKLNEITTSFKQTDPTIKKLSDDVGTIKNLIEKQPTPEDLLSKINDFTQKQKAPLEATLKDIHSKVEPLHQASKDVNIFFYLFSYLTIIYIYFSHLILKKRMMIFIIKLINLWNH